jgi:membrane protein YdbS with pleckstrin-like domain
VASTDNPALALSPLERVVLRFLAVPSAPEVPQGSAGSVRVFRAGDNYYAWLVFEWAVLSAAFFLGLLAASVPAVVAMRTAPDWTRLLLAALLVIAWTAFAFGLIVTFLARRINFRMRWYIVTDRSLRIRSGVFAVRELTMTYRNIQEIRVTAGPLQNALGLATVEVHAAGGGGDAKRDGGGHVGRLEGLSNATEIRDLMIGRLRQYRDSGLGGETPHAEAASGGSDAADAAQGVLDEVRALRAVLVPADSRRRNLDSL